MGLGVLGASVYYTRPEAFFRVVRASVAVKRLGGALQPAHTKSGAQQALLCIGVPRAATRWGRAPDVDGRSDPGRLPGQCRG